jgi:hypothetical protein
MPQMNGMELQSSMLGEKVEIVDAASLQKIATHQHPDEVVALVKIPSIELPPVHCPPGNISYSTV